MTVAEPKEQSDEPGHSQTNCWRGVGHRIYHCRNSGILMTPSDQARLSESIARVSQAVAQLPPMTANEESLYQAFKHLHTTALGPWCLLCDILQTQTESTRLKRRIEDEINLDELFSEKENACGN